MKPISIAIPIKAKFRALVARVLMSEAIDCAMARLPSAKPDKSRPA